jgi:hypothetical protein
MGRSLFDKIIKANIIPQPEAKEKGSNTLKEGLDAVGSGRV